jgi:Tol biopolymer transport system component
MRATGRFLTAIAGLALAVGAASPVAAGPGHDRGHDTTIVWSRFNRQGTSAQIVSADPDGRHVRTLTHPGRGVFDFGPVISPDGGRMVFERNRADGVDIALVDADGQHERVIDLGCADPCADDVAPSWTHDGRRVVFSRIVGPFDLVNESAHSAVLHTANGDGTDVRRLSEPGIDGVYEDYHASFSADGSFLTFVRVRNADIRSAIFRMDADGTDVGQLTPWELDADLPVLSLATRGPTKDMVVFETFGHGTPEGSTQNVATVPATCASLADCSARISYVTDNGAGPEESFNPSWSPDGRRIVYVEFTPGDESHPPSGDIWTVRPDGRGAQPVSLSRRFEFGPDWGPAR